MRFTLSLSAALLCGTAAMAEDLLVRADIAAATVYLSGSEIARQATVSLPEGETRLLIAMPDRGAASRLQVTGPEGVRFGTPQPAGILPLAEGALDSAAEAAARATAEAARNAVQDAQDALTEADGAIRAIELQAAYLDSLTSGSDGAAMPADPTLLPQLLAALGVETARVAAELQAARIERRALADALTDRQTELAIAAQALQRLRPFGTAVEMVAVTAQTEAALEGEITLSYASPDAGWSPSYDIALDSESGAVSVDRLITLDTYGPARWSDVAVTFSTAEPDRTRHPSTLTSSPVRIYDPAPPSPSRGMFDEMEAMEMPAPPLAGVAMEPVIVMADVQVDGLSLSYVYESPVSVGADGSVTLPLDALGFEMETEARAVPRHDQTAFLVAMGENDSGQPILPGEARFFRDGALVGEDWLPMVAEGAEVEMAFGPLDHLQLVWIDRTLAEGDRGLFVSSNTQSRELAFGVENTSGTEETVRILYATPFSEQEDLELELSLDPAPTDRDIEDMRGVHAWEVEAAPGERVLIEMQVDLQWPEGMTLGWRP